MQDIEKIADSKIALECNIHAYDEDDKWRLPEPTALMSAKAHRQKNAIPLVEKLKEIVKSLTIKCVDLMEQIKQLKAKVTKQAEDIDFYKSKVHQQYVKLEQLQEKADDFECVKQNVWADKKGWIDMKDNGNWGGQYSMENIIGCEYNMDRLCGGLLF